MRFSRDTLFASLLAALGHRTNPVADASALTDTLTTTILTEAQDALIDTAVIKSLTRTVLARFDSAAAVYYEAYYLR